MNEDRVFKMIELTGTSSDDVGQAVDNAIAKAAKTVRHMRWFEVTQIRGAIDGAAVGQWQVTVKIGFVVDEE